MCSALERFECETFSTLCDGTGLVGRYVMGHYVMGHFVHHFTYLYFSK
jgi:hypothetical protein